MNHEDIFRIATNICVRCNEKSAEARFCHDCDLHPGIDRLHVSCADCGHEWIQTPLDQLVAWFKTIELC